MSLPNYLSSIKSSGIYRFTWDKSTITNDTTDILRLVVGYSEKGPFNTPVYITSASEFKNTYGTISKKLERNGIYFHRLALQALEKGPILALNLKPFNEEKVSSITFDANIQGSSTKTGEVYKSDIYKSIELAVKDIYNTSRFWTLSPESLLSSTNKANNNTNGYITISSTDSIESSCSIFMRGCSVTGYDITIKDWYNQLNEEIPSYFEGCENYWISDFFVEVYVFKGKFDKQVAASDTLSKYFQVTSDGRVTLQPYIENALGQKVDTLKALANDENSGFVNSYKGVTLPYFKSATGSYLSLDLLFNSDYNTHKLMMSFDTDSLYGSSNGEGVKKLVNNTFNYWNPDFVSFDGVAYDNKQRILSTYATPTCSTKYVKGIQASDFVSTNNGPFEDDYILYQIPTRGMSQEASLDNTFLLPNPEGYGSWSVGDRFVVYDGTLKYVSDNSKSFGVSGNTAGSTSTTQLAPEGKIITLTSSEIVTYKQKASKIDEVNGTDTNYLKVTFVDAAGDEVMLGNSSITLAKINHCTGETNVGISPIYLEGYSYSSSKPDSNSEYGRLTWQQSILNVLSSEEGLFKALTNRIDVDYRYIVDTFEAYIETGVHAPLALLAKEKDNAIAFLNFPAAETFQKHDKQFLDANGNFKVSYIAKGGNPTNNPSPKFELVTETNGASYCSYNTPVKISDGTVKFNCPAAALVSNNFLDKYTSRQPYYIVAGPQYGLLSATGLIGPDFNYDRSDLDVLEPMGVNVTVYVPRKGTFINSNQTAKQSPVTALSKLNVRELVIYLQDEIEKILQTYQWEFNTQTLRDKIKEKADYICENVKNNGGLYAYENICDETNNTDDVINNEMLVLSTSIEPGMGCGKMVQELTIYKKGGMTSSIS